MIKLRPYKDRTDWVEYENCPICDGQNFVYFSTVHSGPFANYPFCYGEITMSTVSSYSKCNDCGLILQTPRMSDERIYKYYSEGIYRQHTPSEIEAMDRSEMVRAKRELEFLKKHGVTPYVHVDIGASRGYFLEQTNQEFGCEIYGYDLNDKYHTVEYSPELTTLPDLVSSIHCLEHCPDPMEELKVYRKIGARYLLLEVPDGSNGSGLHFNHLFFFPKELLEMMVKTVGYNILVSDHDPDTRILAEVL